MGGWHGRQLLTTLDNCKAKRCGLTCIWPHAPPPQRAKGRFTHNLIRLKARDQCNLRVLIGRKGGDPPSSLHTRRWRPTGPKKTPWMKSLLGFLHGALWIRFHGLPELEVGLAQIARDRDFFLIFFPNKTHFRTNYRANFVTDSRRDKHHQVILLNS